MENDEIRLMIALVVTIAIVICMLQLWQAECELRGKKLYKNCGINKLKNNDSDIYIGGI